MESSLEKYTGETASGTEFSIRRGPAGRLVAEIPSLKATSIFEEGTERGCPVLRLKQEIRAGVRKVRPCIPVDAALRAWLDAEVQAHAQDEADAQRAADECPWPDFIFRVGCDGPDSCRAETYPELTARRPDWAAAAETLRALGGDRLRSLATGAEVLPGDLGSWYGLRVPSDAVQRILAVVAQKSQAAEEARQEVAAEEESRRAECFRLARATGCRVPVRTWTEPCSSPGEECDLDSVTEWARPDGSRETTRTHTW